MTKIKKIIKRDGTEVIFNPGKIINAISMAFQEVYGIADSKIVLPIASSVAAKAHIREDITVEDIQDLIMTELSSRGYHKVLRAFSQYRYKHEYLRLLESTIGIINETNDVVGTENSNKNATLAATHRDLMAGELSKEIARRMIPKEIMKANDIGLIKIHDLDYFANPITNCELVNLKDMFTNGTVINKKMIETPKSLRTAMNVATQIAAQVASYTYGGQTQSLSHIAPYVRVSREKIRKEVLEDFKLTKVPDFIIDDAVERRLKKEIKDSVQLFNYQLSTLNSTNGQSPFLSLVMYISEEPEYEKETAMLIEEFLKQRIKGMKNEYGVLATQTFPKLLYFLDENNMSEDSEYFYLTKLAAECVAKRMAPDFISVKRMKEVHGINKAWACMGCRSFLSPWFDENGKVQFYGRGNLGVTTVNLPFIAVETGGNEQLFFERLDEVLETIVKPAAMLRYTKIKDVKAGVAPIMWCHGAIARLNPEDKIDKAIKDGRFSVSLGYSGIYETVKHITGESHTTEKGQKLALKIMNYLNDRTKTWKKETGLGFGLYGTPQESGGGLFAEKIKEKFGEIEDITEKGFVTNSFHVDVREEIDAFSKLTVESQFEELSTGGVVCYVEVPNMQKNTEAVLQIMRHIYETNIYAEINSESDVCGKCGYQGTMENDPETFEWVCPCCGNRDQKSLSVVRRTCGYLGETVWSPGRLQDILQRVKHL